MRKLLFGISCGLLGIFSAYGAYAIEGDGTRGPFNPPKEIDFTQLEQQRLTNEEMQKKLEKEKKYEQRIKQVSMEVNAIIGRCKESYDAQEIRTYAQLAACYNPEIMAVYQRADYPYMDLMQSLNDKRFELGQRIDKNLITETEAEAELNQFYEGIKEEEHKRNNELTKYAQISSNN